MTYSDGELVQGLSTGRIEGAIFGAIFDGTTWTSSQVIAKLGAVSPVPLPASLVLMLSGILSVASLRLKKK